MHMPAKPEATFTEANPVCAIALPTLFVLFAGPSNGEQVAKLDRVIDIALKGHIQPVSLDKQAVAASA